MILNNSVRRVILSKRASELLKNLYIVKFNLLFNLKSNMASQQTSEAFLEAS